MSTTLSTLQAGGTTQCKLVVAIEGVPYLLSDASSSAVLTAWSGTDWSQVLGGLFVEMQNRQQLELHNPFTTTGSCLIHVLDTDGTDVFGKLVNRRAAGAETVLAATADRNDGTITVKSTAGFSASGTVYIGTEAIAYTGKSGTTFTTCTRGKYSPFGCESSGTGGTRFGNHHRVAVDSNHVQINPVVSQEPRVWIGKRVGVWLHTWNGTALNSKADAQLLFAGRICGIADDANSFHTVLECKHELEALSDYVIGKDIWSANIPDGMWIATGRSFRYADYKEGGGVRNANALTVVASGASGANQMNEGFYSGSQLCEKLNTWLASELGASRLWGTYRWSSPVGTNDGLRTRCDWKISHASDVSCYFGLVAPAEVCAFLGLSDTEPAQNSQEQGFAPGNKTTNVLNQASGAAVPFRTVVFRPYGPGRVGQEFAEAIVYDTENERGTFSDQRDMLPLSIKDACPTGHTWGVFLLDERALMVGAYDSSTGRLDSCWLAPYQQTGDKAPEAITYIGRRFDEQESGPIAVRQVFILEASFETLFNTFLYNSGTSGYNSDNYDTLPFGLGVGIPGELLGERFELSVAHLSGASAPMVVVIDEPTKLSDLIGADLLIRRAFFRWKDEHIEIGTWKTPTAHDAVMTLTEENKAAPVGTADNFRCASEESATFQRPITKVDFARDFAIGRDGQYLRSVWIEDQVAVDDAGGEAKPNTIKLRNTYAQFASTGAAIEKLMPDYIAMTPIISRPARKIARPLNVKFFEGYSVGDVAIVDDDFARDPLTGARGVLLRPALITAHGYNLGGPSFDGGSPRPMGGDIELFFLDLHRGKQFGPSAQVDDTQANAGYSAGGPSLTCYAHKYSETTEDADASWFEPGDKITIVEIDPANPAAPLTWDRTIATNGVSGNVITLTATLSSPAWDTTKKYRIMPSKWSLATATQREYAFQADYTDLMIEDTEVPYHYIVSEDVNDFAIQTGAGRWRTFTPNT